MSRTLTSAQIIAQGHYLEPDFDPSSLTVSQLLGVLGYHNISYPTPYSKPKLIAQFNAQVKPKATKFHRDRLKAQSSIASDEGIMDGVTGEPVAASRPQPAVRRSSRRLSRAPIEEKEKELSPVRPDPPKRRRSSAQPNLGGPSRAKLESKPSVVVEESEPEEEYDIPVRKVGRSKKTSQAAGQQSRRVSRAEDSGWEDNNVFQSGAESSSPARPPPKASRKSVGLRKARKSVTAPPEMAPSSSPIRGPELSFASPQTKFEPQLPASVTRGPRMMAPQFITPAEDLEETIELVDTDYPGDEPTEDYFGAQPVDLDEVVEELQDDQDQDEAEFDDEDLDLVISQRLAEGHTDLIPAAPSGNRPNVLNVLFLVLTCLLFYGGVEYKREFSTIGYCDMGQSTNSQLEYLRARRHAIETCNVENRTTLPDGSPCPLPIPFPHPDTCTPCPSHGTCTQFQVACDKGYLLQRHWLIRGLSTLQVPDTVKQGAIDIANGFPGGSSVGLGPQCVEDPRRKSHINGLGRWIEQELGRVYGQRICEGSSRVFPENEGGDARRWGEELGQLSERVAEMSQAKNTPGRKSDDDVFPDAIQQLIEWGGVFLGEASDGKRYIAHKTPQFTWSCQVSMKFWALFEAYRSVLVGMVAIFAAYKGTRRRQSRKAIEGKRVAELVQMSMESLRAQDWSYHEDGADGMLPYLSSVQLRDTLLADEHSVPARERLWARVERVIEGNANVRANLEEVEGDQEMRVWRWVGPSSPRKLEG